MHICMRSLRRPDRFASADFIPTHPPNQISEGTMSIKLLRFLLGIAFPLLACISVATAQTVTGSVTGEVTDSSGAVIARASVVAHNLDTNVDTPTTTNSDGVYHIDFLPIGHYQVSAKANGFDQAT